MPTVEMTVSRHLATPGADSWDRTALPDDPNKYFTVSTDCHISEPKDRPNSCIAPMYFPMYLKCLPRLEMVNGPTKYQSNEKAN